MTRDELRRDLSDLAHTARTFPRLTGETGRRLAELFERVLAEPGAFEELCATLEKKGLL